jgi:hypothetical protein
MLNRGVMAHYYFSEVLRWIVVDTYIGITGVHQ